MAKLYSRKAIIFPKMSDNWTGQEELALWVESKNNVHTNTSPAHGVLKQ